jgi:alpha-glucosidase (family GH31 glycosyl hydrolase)
MNRALLGLARIHGITSQFAALRRQTYLKNRSGQVFPDWFSPNARRWWTQLLSDWYVAGVQYSGIWLDMNEVSSFCDGSWFAQSVLAPLIHHDGCFAAVVPVQI